LIIKQLPVGDFMANAYIVAPDDCDEAMIIDPGARADTIISNLGKLKARYIILTHGHYDHIQAVEEVARLAGVTEIIAGADELKMLADPNTNLSAMLGDPVSITNNVRAVADGDEIALGPITFKVLETPGHTPGGICLYTDDDGSGKPVVFTGDTLFPGSVGRTDFPGGSMDAQMNSIRAKLLALPDETAVYSGHGDPTTIGHERKHNPFLT